MINLFQIVGHNFFSLLTKIYNISHFVFLAIINIFIPPFYFKIKLKYFFDIFFLSLPIIALTSIFSGAALALQSYVGFSRFNAESTIATVVSLSIVRELAPVFTALMMISRVCSSITAEISTMRVTNQIDAIITLSTNPIKYIISQRIFILLISMPILVIISDILGIMGGYLIAIYYLDFSPILYIKNSFKFIESIDILSGIIKSIFFAFIISITSCYIGYNTRGGAAEVGRATTNAVVYSSILVLIFNYIITKLLFM